jgi:hypothetical protein
MYSLAVRSALGKSLNDLSQPSEFHQGATETTAGVSVCCAAATDDNTRGVPANGALLTRTDLQTQRSMYFAMYKKKLGHYSPDW